MAESVPKERSTRYQPVVSAVHPAWASAGLGRGHGFLSITASPHPGLGDVAPGSTTGLPKVHVDYLVPSPRAVGIQ